MTRVRRFAVGIVLVVALLTATFAGRAQHPPVPAGLVGVWKGGSHSNGPWYYEFSADGGYRTWPVAAPGVPTTGTVVVDGSSITFSNGGAPVTATWSVSNGVLLLDGQRYARP